MWNYNTHLMIAAPLDFTIEMNCLFTERSPDNKPTGHPLPSLMAIVMQPLGKAVLIWALTFSSISLGSGETLNAFVEDATQLNNEAMHSAQIAMKTSADNNVKAFAGRVQRAQLKEQQKLTALARELKMAIPQAPALAERANTLKLETSDATFDKVYINGQVELFDQLLSLYKKEASSSENARLSKLQFPPRCATWWTGRSVPHWVSGGSQP